MDNLLKANFKNFKLLLLWLDKKIKNLNDTQSIIQLKILMKVKTDLLYKKSLTINLLLIKKQSQVVLGVVLLIPKQQNFLNLIKVISIQINLLMIEI